MKRNININDGKRKTQRADGEEGSRLNDAVALCVCVCVCVCVRVCVDPCRQEHKEQEHKKCPRRARQNVHLMLNPASGIVLCHSPESLSLSVKGSTFRSGRR